MSRQYTRDRKKATKSPTYSSIATKALAAYGAYKVLSWAWRELGANPTDRDSEELHEESCLPTNGQYRKNRHRLTMSIARRRQHRLAYCQKEAINTMSSLLITLKNTINSQTDFSKQIKDLKQMRSPRSVASSAHIDNGRLEDFQSKRDLWDEIKTKAITRLVVTVYSHSLLTLLLTVQIHVLGGKLFRSQLKQQELGDDAAQSQAGPDQSLFAEHPQVEEEEEEEERSSYHKILVQTYGNFFRVAVDSLVNNIEKVVDSELSKWNVIDEHEEKVCSITLHDLEDGMNCIRQKIDHLQIGQYICEILSDCEISCDDDARLAFEESLDVLESPVFENVYREVINMTFDVVGMKGYAPLFNDGDQPLVSVITKMKNLCNIFYVSPDEPNEERWVDKPMNSYSNIFLYYYDRMNSVKELGDISFG